MKILVTGGAGFVGSNLIRILLEEDHQVISIDNYSTGVKENHLKGCKYWEYDLAEELSPPLVENYEVIYHIAALARIQPSLRNPTYHIKNNYLSTLNVLKCAKENQSQVIYAGSSSYYGGVYKSPYAFSKFQGEQLCKLYSDLYNMNIGIARFYNVYGPNQIEWGPYATAVGIWEKQYRNNQPLTITGDGTQRRDFTHVYDIVAALKLMLDGNYKADIFELGSGKNFSMNEVVAMFGKHCPKKYLPSRQGEYDKTLCYYTFSRTDLGWEPQYSLEDYINGNL